MRKLSFSARKQRRCSTCHAELPHMFHEPWCEKKRLKNSLITVAQLLVIFVAALMWWWEASS